MLKVLPWLADLSEKSGRRRQAQIRNPKAGGRRPKEVRNPKSEVRISEPPRGQQFIGSRQARLVGFQCYQPCYSTATSHSRFHLTEGLNPFNYLVN
jgi:hypothetical protein